MVEAMHTFVYGSRVIENEQQIRLESNVKKFGNFVQTVVKFFVVFILFTLINAMLSNLAQHTNLFSLSSWRLVEEAVRLLIVDNAFTTSSMFYQDFLAVVASLTFVCVHEYGLVVRTLSGACEHNDGEQSDSSKHFEQVQVVNTCAVVSYRHKVCFLS